MKFDRQLQPATETSWVVNNSKMADGPILKIVISPYLSENSSDFDEILYTAADFELDKRHVIKNEKFASEWRQWWYGMEHICIEPFKNVFANVCIASPCTLHPLKLPYICHVCLTVSVFLSEKKWGM